MTDRVDFSNNASVYDCRHGALLSGDALQHLVEAAHLKADARVLDVGAGTGRVAIVLAASGRRVVALDPALAMLQTMVAKADALCMRSVVGEGASLPFPAACFDAVVLARVMYLMSDWRHVLREAIRVLAPGGRLLHEWGNGSRDEAWVQIREKARALFEEGGIRNPFHPGARDESEVDAFLTSMGLARSGEVSVGGSASMTLADFVRKIGTGECSYTWSVPSEVLRPAMAQLERWAAEHFTMDVPAFIPRELVWTIYRKETVG